jgi:hypothetical protein
LALGWRPRTVSAACSSVLGRVDVQVEAAPGEVGGCLLRPLLAGVADVGGEDIDHGVLVGWAVVYEAFEAVDPAEGGGELAGAKLFDGLGESVGDLGLDLELALFAVVLVGVVEAGAEGEGHEDGQAADDGDGGEALCPVELEVDRRQFDDQSGARGAEDAWGAPVGLSGPGPGGLPWAGTAGRGRRRGGWGSGGGPAPRVPHDVDRA